MSVEIIDTLKQKNNADFPLADCNDVKGGFHQVNNTAERDNIPMSRRKEGMFCSVKNDAVYELKGGITNRYWRVYTANVDTEKFISREEFASLMDTINQSISAIQGKLVDIEKRLIVLEGGEVTRTATCGTFLAGELRCSEGLAPTREADEVKSFLSEEFKEKFGVKDNE